VLSYQNKRELKRILFVQLLFACVVMISFGFAINYAAALSALYGAAISILPTWLFVSILFRYQGASKATKIVHHMYLGEGMKLLVSAGLFGLVLVWAKPCWWVLFVSFIVTQLGLGVSPLLINWLKK
jgi:F0F1-type ATP synthase assembly protein I